MRQKLGCVVMLVFLAIAGCTDPFAPRELTGLSGTAAANQLASAWPTGIDAAKVKSVHHRTESSRDSFSTWWRIELPLSLAEQWIKETHSDEERDVTEMPREPGIDGPIEGVRRVIGAIPIAAPTGDIPTWWSPPTLDCNATEFMLWYSENSSGVARGTYTIFDATKTTLWVYQFAAQHHELWKSGSVPAGEQLDVTKLRDLDRDDK